MSGLSDAKWEDREEEQPVSRPAYELKHHTLSDFLG
jgi:hypothetical protein